MVKEKRDVTVGLIDGSVQTLTFLPYKVERYQTVLPIGRK
jgi:hypothetical protein